MTLFPMKICRQHILSSVIHSRRNFAIRYISCRLDMSSNNNIHIINSAAFDHRKCTCSQFLSRLKKNFQFPFLYNPLFFYFFCSSKHH